MSLARGCDGLENARRARRVARRGGGARSRVGTASRLRSCLLRTNGGSSVRRATVSRWWRDVPCRANGRVPQASLWAWSGSGSWYAARIFLVTVAPSCWPMWRKGAGAVPRALSATFSGRPRRWVDHPGRRCLDATAWTGQTAVPSRPWRRLTGYLSARRGLAYSMGHWPFQRWNAWLKLACSW